MRRLFSVLSALLARSASLRVCLGPARIHSATTTDCVPLRVAVTVNQAARTVATK